MGLSIAITACARNRWRLCPPVIAAALAVAGAAANYLVKVMAYDECMSRTEPIISNRGGGGGGSDSGDGCYDVVWEISYDGGWSWSYYDTQRVCGRQYET
jgi:hypothetical protein